MPKVNGTAMLAVLGIGICKNVKHDEKRKKRNMAPGLVHPQTYQFTRCAAGGKGKIKKKKKKDFKALT